MIEYKELTTMDEMEQVQILEEKVWGLDVLPTHQTITAVKNGGIMIGAFDQEQIVGFSYGFAGFQNGRAYLCSHMLGIEENYRSQGIGEKLKRKQREIAIEKGFDRMQWTYDPLETRNAYLNLTKLNGICDTYVENCYGEMKDGLNRGLPSDRFELHWHLTSPYVVEKQAPSIENPIQLNSISWKTADLAEFTSEHVNELTAPVYSLSVPKDFQGLKKASSELALEWRLQTRNEFQRLFQAGYAAVRLKPYEQHADYIFVKKDTINLGGK